MADRVRARASVFALAAVECVLVCGCSSNPFVAIHNIDISPNPAKAGDTVTIAFESTVPLEEFPEVAVDGNSASLSTVDGQAYVYSYTVTGAEFEGNAIVSISGVQLDGQPLARNASIELDFTAPVIGVDICTVWDRTPALTGTTDDPNAVIELVVDGQTHAVTNSGNGTWVLNDNILSELAPGVYDVALSAEDIAGNVSTDATLDELTINTFTDIAAGLHGVWLSHLAWGDYDNDGDLDLGLGGEWYDGTIHRSTLIYENDAGSFTDIGAGLAGTRESCLAWGDYDGDGDVDLAVSGTIPSAPAVNKIYRNDAGSFVDTVAPLRDPTFSSMAWGDVDNDGDLDLSQTGYYMLSGGCAIEVYQNDNGIFSERPGSISGVRSGTMAWGDLDNDGDLDLAVTGDDAQGGSITRVYRNNLGVFADSGNALPGLRQSCLAWGDYDNDGDLDLAVAGLESVTARISRIFRNDGGMLYDTEVPLTGVSLCSLAWGDYDGDGDLDLLLAGYDGSAMLAHIYRNDSGRFVKISVDLAGVANCSVAWGDYDNDGDLDLALSGYVSNNNYISKIYRNDGFASNNPPSSPASLAASSVGTGPYQVTFSWGHSADAESPQYGLSYNIRVGTSPGGDEVASSMADPVSGYRRVATRGMIQPGGSTNKLTLNLAAGTYYWSVQAIDTGLAGGPWASEEQLILP